MLNNALALPLKKFATAKFPRLALFTTRLPDVASIVALPTVKPCLTTKFFRLIFYFSYITGTYVPISFICVLPAKPVARNSTFPLLMPVERVTVLPPPSLIAPYTVT